MLITTDRVLIAVVALGFFYFIQRQGRRRSEEYLKRMRERQRREMSEDADQLEEQNEEGK